MSVSSAGEGHGSTFCFTLPMKRAKRAHTEASKMRKLGSFPPTRRIEASCHYNVLVVDDSQINRKMLVKLFTSIGCTCEQADNGESAVAAVKARFSSGKCFDAILMDFVMVFLLFNAYFHFIDPHATYTSLLWRGLQPLRSFAVLEYSGPFLV